MDTNQHPYTVKISPPPWMMGVATVVGIIFVAFLVAQTRNVWRTYAFIGRSSETPHTIAISGEGRVTAIPDIATVSLGMQVEKKSVADAQRQNTETMNKLLSRLTALAIAKEDITTTEYSVYPQYDYDNGRQALRGYQVSQQVRIKIRDFEKITPVLGLIGELSLNQVGGLSFTIDDPEEFRQQARIKALEQAKKKAAALAQAAGVRLGRLVSFSESDSGMPTPYPVYAARGMGGGADMAAPEIAAGSQEVNVSVTVSYELE